MDAYFIHLGSKIDKYRGPPRPQTMSQELRSVSFWRACFAEFLGTTIFVFLGLSSVVTANGNIVQISFGFGLGALAMIQFIGHVSGGHLDPVISLAMMVSRHISPLRAVLYMICQLVGGIAGSGILYSIVGRDRLAGTVNHVVDVTAAQGFGNEVMLTFVLLVVVYGTDDPERRSYGTVSLSIGLTVALNHFAGVGISGGSMNPARSFGPALLTGVWKDQWVYWAGPAVGAILGSLVYKYILRPYKGIKSYEEAVQLMLSEQSQLPVPSNFEVAKIPSLTNGEGRTNQGMELEEKA